MGLEKAWANFGIVDPIKTLENHSDPAMVKLRAMAAAYAMVAPPLEEQVAALLLIGYGLGLSRGHLEALENPAKAMHDERKSLLNQGVTDGEIVDSLREALKTR